MLFRSLWLSLLFAASVAIFSRASADEAPYLAMRKSSEVLYRNFIAHKNQFVGIELLIAESSDIAFYSRWGHAMLRIVDSDDDPLNDLVITYLAEVKGNLEPVKALSGEYRALPFARTLMDVINEYSVKEARKISRYVLPLTQTQKAEFPGNLITYLAQPETANTSYHFITRNCANLLVDLLKTTRLIAENSPSTLVPVEIAGQLKSLGYLPYPAQTIPSISEINFRVMQLFQQDPRKGGLEFFLKMDAAELAGANQVLQRSLSARDYEAFLLGNSRLPRTLRQNRHHSFPEVFAQSMPRPVYQFCENSDCANEVAQFIYQNFGSATQQRLIHLQPHSDASRAHWNGVQQKLLLLGVPYENK